MDREKLFKLINLALDIQERGKGVDGFPFVLVSSSNYGEGVRIEVMDDKYRSGAPYDGCYTFNHLRKTSDRVYKTCLEHLEEMKEKAEGFFQ